MVEYKKKMKETFVTGTRSLKMRVDVPSIETNHLISAIISEYISTSTESFEGILFSKRNIFPRLPQFLITGHSIYLIPRY
jgi:hypothetical protein